MEQLKIPNVLLDETELHIFIKWTRDFSKYLKELQPLIAFL